MRVKTVDTAPVYTNAKKVDRVVYMRIKKVNTAMVYKVDIGHVYTSLQSVVFYHELLSSTGSVCVLLLLPTDTTSTPLLLTSWLVFFNKYF